MGGRLLQAKGLLGLDVSFCKGYHQELSEQVLANYNAMERFDEGAGFLEEFGWAEEDPWSSRGPKRTRGPRGSRRGLRVAGGDQGLILGHCVILWASLGHVPHFHPPNRNL